MIIHLFIVILTVISFEGLYGCDYKLHTRFRARGRSIIQSRIRSAMEQNGVVPDVIDVTPTEKIQVRYRSGVDVNLGNELTPLSVKDEPIVNWKTEEGQYYTLVMTDPDAPSRKEPIWGEVKHWLVVNIPGTDLTKGEVLAPYRGSGPPEGSGLHRYIFLVYKQSGLLKHSETPIDLTNTEARLKFKVREFAKKYNLGQPFAGNFYQAQSDEYSRAIWAKRALMAKLKSSMEENGIVPDIIDVFPTDIIQVKYSSGVEVNLGNELTPFSVKDEPKVDWTVEEGKYYTLIMTDPDAPSRKEPTRGEIKHWLVMNIPGTDLSKGETLAGYRGSGPGEGSGLHRYIFLVYKQSGHLKHSENPVDSESREGRVNFKVREFAKKYNLGQPFAGNFYQAQSDEYSKQRRAQRAQTGN